MKELPIEDKELLLADLCARLPYNVKVSHPDYGDEPQILDTIFNYEAWNGGAIQCAVDDIDEEKHQLIKCRPYLRPMSSMTEEEMKEYHSLIEEQKNMSYFTFCSCVTRYLDSIHVDHRAMKDKDGKWKTMIELGLALEAPDGMYDNEQNK